MIKVPLLVAFLLGSYIAGALSSDLRLEDSEFFEDKQISELQENTEGQHCFRGCCRNCDWCRHKIYFKKRYETQKKKTDEKCRCWIHAFGGKCVEKCNDSLLQATSEQAWSLPKFDPNKYKNDECMEAGYSMKGKHWRIKESCVKKEKAEKQEKARVKEELCGIHTESYENLRLHASSEFSRCQKRLSDQLHRCQDNQTADEEAKEEEDDEKNKKERRRRRIKRRRRTRHRRRRKGRRKGKWWRT